MGEERMSAKAQPRYVVVDDERAIARGWIEKPSNSNGSDYRTSIYDTAETPPREVCSDGAEPEDATWSRDLRPAVDELNRLAAEAATDRAKLEAVCVSQSVKLLRHIDEIAALREECERNAVAIEALRADNHAQRTAVLDARKAHALAADVAAAEATRLRAALRGIRAEWAWRTGSQQLAAIDAAMKGHNDE